MEGETTEISSTPAQSIPLPPPNNCASFDIETSGLNPKENHITCNGWLAKQGVTQYTDSYDVFNSDPLTAEKSILNRFFRDLLVVKDVEAIVTYHGDFDYSFIEKRADEHNLRIPKAFENIPHIDLALFCKKINGYKIAKDYAATKYANIYVPRKNSGAFIARAYHNRQVTLETHVDMLAHNVIDLAVTLKLYKFLKEYPDFQEFYQGVKND